VAPDYGRRQAAYRLAYFTDRNGETGLPGIPQRRADHQIGYVNDAGLRCWRRSSVIVVIRSIVAVVVIAVAPEISCRTSFGIIVTRL
jgi:hypothetical protein